MADKDNMEMLLEKRDNMLIEGLHDLNSLYKMEDYVHKCLEIAKSDNRVKGADVLAVVNRVNKATVHYSSALPSQVAEPFSTDSLTLYLRVVVDGGDGKQLVGRVGSMSVFDKEIVKNLVELACRNAIYDSDFVSLPSPELGEKAKKRIGYDEKVLKLGGKETSDLAFAVANGALKVYADALEKKEIELFEKDFIPLTNLTVDGDVRTVGEIYAYESTTGSKSSDICTKVQASVTCGKEDASPDREWGLEGESKACNKGASIYLDHFNAEEIGATAARRALKLQSGKTGDQRDVYDILFEKDSSLRGKKEQRIETGRYTVIVSPQVVEEMMQYTDPFDIMRALEHKNPIFTPEMTGKQVMSPKISVYDDPHVEDSVSSMNGTHEGFSTRKRTLVKNGIFTSEGYIMDDYYSKKYRKVLDAVGMDSRPGNGFSKNEGKSEGSSCHPNHTNLVIESNETVPFKEMIENIKVGEKVIFVTKFWYTYPLNKGHEGSESSYGPLTSSCPTTSYLLEKRENGDMEVTPLKPNTYRFFVNERDLLSNPKQVSSEREAINGWATDYTVIAPYMMMDNVFIENIAEYIG